MSACEIFLTVELLLRIKALYSRIATQNKWNSKAKPHLCMTHEGIVSLTIIIQANN